MKGQTCRLVAATAIGVSVSVIAGSFPEAGSKVLKVVDWMVAWLGCNDCKLSDKPYVLVIAGLLVTAVSQYLLVRQIFATKKRIDELSKTPLELRLIREWLGIQKGDERSAAHVISALRRKADHNETLLCSTRTVLGITDQDDLLATVTRLRIARDSEKAAAFDRIAKLVEGATHLPEHLENLKNSEQAAADKEKEIDELKRTLEGEKKDVQQFQGVLRETLEGLVRRAEEYTGCVKGLREREEKVREQEEKVALDTEDHRNTKQWLKEQKERNKLVEQQCKVKKTELDAQEQMLHEREAALEQLKEREAQCESREGKLDDQEAGLKRERQSLDTAKRKMDRRLEALKTAEREIKDAAGRLQGYKEQMGEVLPDDFQQSLARSLVDSWEEEDDSLQLEQEDGSFLNEEMSEVLCNEIPLDGNREADNPGSMDLALDDSGVDESASELELSLASDDDSAIEIVQQKEEDASAQPGKKGKEPSEEVEEWIDQELLRRKKIGR